MGRNGNKPPVFSEMLQVIRNKCLNNEEEITLQELLLGKEYGRNAETSYAYRLIKLGYLQIIEGSLKERKAKLKILRHFPPNFKSIDLRQELKVFSYDRALKNNEELLKRGEILPLD